MQPISELIALLVGAELYDIPVLHLLDRLSISAPDQTDIVFISDDPPDRGAGPAGSCSGLDSHAVEQVRDLIGSHRDAAGSVCDQVIHHDQILSFLRVWPEREAFLTLQFIPFPSVRRYVAEKLPLEK